MVRLLTLATLEGMTLIVNRPDEMLIARASATTPRLDLEPESIMQIVCVTFWSGTFCRHDVK